MGIYEFSFEDFEKAAYEPNTSSNLLKIFFSTGFEEYDLDKKVEKAEL